MATRGGGTDGRTEGRTDGRMEIPPCVLQDIGPLGPLPKKESKNANPIRELLLLMMYACLFVPLSVNCLSVCLSVALDCLSSIFLLSSYTADYLPLCLAVCM